MAQFLSSEWVAQLDALLRGAEPPLEVATVVIEQHVDDVAYQVSIGSDGCGAMLGTGLTPTVVYRQTRDTAVAIARQERTAHEAFMLGDLVVEGDPNALAEALPALEWLGATIAPLQEATVFD